MLWFCSSTPQDCKKAGSTTPDAHNRVGRCAKSANPLSGVCPTGDWTVRDGSRTACYRGTVCAVPYQYTLPTGYDRGDTGTVGSYLHTTLSLGRAASQRAIIRRRSDQG